jgi:hypothetical protein
MASHEPSGRPKQEPGIKGSVFKGIVAHALEVCAKRNISTADLERRFGKDGVALLHATISPAVWYPITFYGKLREFLREVEGGGSERYSIEAGAESARRLILSGMYPQLVRLDGFSTGGRAGLLTPAQKAQRLDQFKQQLSRVAGIHGALFNFSSMQLAVDPKYPDRVQLEYWDFGAMPPDGRLAVLGFWNELGGRWSQSKRDLFQKVDLADHYLLRMTRDVSAL